MVWDRLLAVAQVGRRKGEKRVWGDFGLGWARSGGRVGLVQTWRAEPRFIPRRKKEEKRRRIEEKEKTGIPRRGKASKKPANIKLIRRWLCVSERLFALRSRTFQILLRKGLHLLLLR